MDLSFLAGHISFLSTDRSRLFSMNTSTSDVSAICMLAGHINLSTVSDSFRKRRGDSEAGRDCWFAWPRDEWRQNGDLS